MSGVPLIFSIPGALVEQCDTEQAQLKIIFVPVRTGRTREPLTASTKLMVSVYD